MSLQIGDAISASTHDGFLDDVSLKGPMIGLGVDFRASLRQGPRLRSATASAVAVSDEA